MWPASGFQASAEGATVSPNFGGHSEGETPLPIPNRAVKPLCADGTWLERAWESRSPPIIHTGRPSGRPVLFGAPRLAAMSTLAIILIAVGVVLLLLLSGGLVVARRRLESGDLTKNIEQADQA